MIGYRRAGHVLAFTVRNDGLRLAYKPPAILACWSSFLAILDTVEDPLALISIIILYFCKGLESIQLKTFPLFLLRINNLANHLLVEMADRLRQAGILPVSKLLISLALNVA